MRRFFVLAGLMYVACGLKLDETDGKKCDEAHPCRSDRRCVDGRCLTDGDGGGNVVISDAGIDAGPVDLMDSGFATRDASVVGLDASIDVDAGQDAGPVDAGFLDAGVDAGSPLGRPCVGDGPCASGICSQGVCCNARCDGACQSCGGGNCQLRTPGTAGVPACFAQNGCNGTQTTCPSSCTSGTCTSGLRCNNGACVKKTSMLSLNFDNGWSPQMNGYAYGGSGMAASINGQVHLSNLGGRFSGLGIESIEVFDFEDSSVTVEMVSTGTLSTSREAYLSLKANDTLDGNLVLGISGSTIFSAYHVSGSPEFIKPKVIPFTTSGSIKLRMRAVKNAGTYDVFYEVSLNGVWSTLTSLPNPIQTPLRNMRIQFAAGCFAATECVAATAVFDNLNPP
jgi:hypothetical protein